MLPVSNPYISRPRALSGCDRREQHVGIPDVEENQRRAPFWLLGARLREVHERDIAKLTDCHIWRPQGRRLIGISLPRLPSRTALPRQ